MDRFQQLSTACPHADLQTEGYTTAKMKRIPCELQTALLALLVLVTVEGCAAHPKSDKVAGEVVVLELVEQPDVRAGTIPSELMGTAAGALVDMVQGLIEAEAKKLERQFGKAEYRSDFWRVTKSGDVFEIGPKYKSFVIKRFTDGFPEAKVTPAMEFEVELVRSHNDRLFLLKPVRFVTRQAKAKVVNDDGVIDATINITVVAMWVDKNQVLHQEQVASAEFEVMNYDLDDAKVKTDFGDSMAGWFPGVPVSVDSAGNPLWITAWKKDQEQFFDGAFKVSVYVTERDASEAREYLERAAKFVGEQRARVVEKTGSLVPQE